MEAMQATKPKWLYWSESTTIEAHSKKKQREHLKGKAEMLMCWTDGEQQVSGLCGTGTFAGSTCDDSAGSWSLSITWAASVLGVCAE